MNIAQGQQSSKHVRHTASASKGEHVADRQPCPKRPDIRVRETKAPGQQVRHRLERQAIVRTFVKNSDTRFGTSRTSSPCICSAWIGVKASAVEKRLPES